MAHIVCTCTTFSALWQQVTISLKVKLHMTCWNQSRKHQIYGDAELSMSLQCPTPSGCRSQLTIGFTNLAAKRHSWRLRLPSYWLWSRNLGSGMHQGACFVAPLHDRAWGHMWQSQDHHVAMCHVTAPRAVKWSGMAVSNNLPSACSQL